MNKGCGIATNCIFSATDDTIRESSDTTEKNVYKINTTQDSDERFFISTVSFL